MGDYEELQKLLGFKLPEESFQAQELPQEFTKGLLGSAGGQDKNLQSLISNGNRAAEQMAQPENQLAENNLLTQRQAATQQQAQQALAQKQQEQAGLGALLGTVASFFIPSGSITGFLKKKF